MTGAVKSASSVVPLRVTVTDAVLAPMTGCFDEAVLSEVGFLKSRKSYNLYWIPFEDALDVSEVDSFYFDVF